MYKFYCKAYFISIAWFLLSHAETWRMRIIKSSIFGLKLCLWIVIIRQYLVCSYTDWNLKDPKFQTITECQSVKCLRWVLVNRNFINSLKICVFCQKTFCQIFLLCHPVMSYKIHGISKLSILKSCIRFTDLFPGKTFFCVQKTVNKCHNLTTYMCKIIANTMHTWMWHKHAVKHDIFFYTWMNGSYWKIAFTDCGLSSSHFWRGRGSGHVFCVRGRGVILLDRRLHADIYKPGDRHPTERLFIAGVLQGIGDPANVSPHLVQLLQTHKEKTKSALLFHWQCCLQIRLAWKLKGAI